MKVSKRVLIVEDNADSAEGLTILLEFWGHTVQKVFDGTSVLEAVRSFRPDVILLDIGLPGMDGYEVASSLRAAGHSMKIIALTGYSRDSDRARAFEVGIDHHVVKPINRDELKKFLS